MVRQERAADHRRLLQALTVTAQKAARMRAFREALLRHQMIRLSVTPAAHAVIVATMPASASTEKHPTTRGDVRVWVEPEYVDRLRAMRKPGESFSDVIVRLAEASEGA